MNSNVSLNNFCVYYFYNDCLYNHSISTKGMRKISEIDMDISVQKVYWIFIYYLTQF